MHKTQTRQKRFKIVDVKDTKDAKKIGNEFLNQR